MSVVSLDYGKAILFHLQKVGYKREAENLNQLIKHSKKNLKIRNKNKQTKPSALIEVESMKRREA